MLDQFTSRAPQLTTRSGRNACGGATGKLSTEKAQELLLQLAAPHVLEGCEPLLSALGNAPAGPEGLDLLAALAIQVDTELRKKMQSLS